MAGGEARKAKSRVSKQDLILDENFESDDMDEDEDDDDMDDDDADDEEFEEASDCEVNVESDVLH
jgi:hypothetical protein